MGRPRPNAVKSRSRLNLVITRFIWRPRIGGPLFCRAFDGPERREAADGYHHDDLTVLGSAVLLASPGRFAMLTAMRRASAFVGNLAAKRRSSWSSKYSGEVFAAGLIAHDETGGVLLHRQGLSRPILWLVVSPAPEQIKKCHLAPPEFHASGCAERWASPRLSRIKADPDHASDQKRTAKYGTDKIEVVTGTA